MKTPASAVALASMLLATAASAETLTLYTSQPADDAQTTIDAFMAANPGITVDFVREGTTKLMAKLQAEIAAGAPGADVLLIADTVTMEGLKDEGHLLPYASPEAAAYPAGMADAGGHYHPTKLITTGIVYNTAAETRPESWKDLADPALKGQVMMPSPLTSGAALIHMQALASQPEFGWPYYEALRANDTVASGGNGAVFKAVASGEKPYGVVVDYLPIREKAKGVPVEFVFPAEGVTAVTEPVAILASTDAPQAAKTFVDFLLSEQGQQLVAQQGYIPARPGVALPAGYPAREDIRLIELDPAKARADSDADRQRYEGLFGAE